jgi:hypothetical protein
LAGRRFFEARFARRLATRLFAGRFALFVARRFAGRHFAFFLSHVLPARQAFLRALAVVGRLILARFFMVFLSVVAH